MWELDYKESWALKNWCFWNVVLEKTLESPLDWKEIQPVHPKGNQSWIFIGRTDAEAETPILGPPDAKSWLIGKDPDAGKDWRQEKGMTEDETVRWHHWLNGHEFEETPGVGDGQGGLVCCGSWGCKELDMTEWLNWTDWYAWVSHMSQWVKNLPVRQLDTGSIPAWGRSLGEGNPLQYFCLVATVHGVEKSQTQLSAHLRTHTHKHIAFINIVINLKKRIYCPCNMKNIEKRELQSKAYSKIRKKHTQKCFCLHFTCGFNNDFFHPLIGAFLKNQYFSLLPVHSQS